MVKRLFIVFAVVGFGLSLLACGNQSQKVFMSSKNLGGISVVAVMPFENLTEDRNASDVITEIFRTQLFREGKFKVLDGGDLLRRLKAKKKRLPKVLNRATAARLAREIGIDGIFLGSVIEYTYLREVRDGRVVAQEPAVGLQARLINSKSGLTVWAASHSRSSYAMLVTNRDSIARVAEIAVSKMTATLQPPRRNK